MACTRSFTELYCEALRDSVVVSQAIAAVVLGVVAALGFVGLADVAADGTYSVAAQHGPVTVAAVLASLYPVVTAPAARGFLRERLRAVQAAGAALALLGTLLLATG